MGIFKSLNIFRRASKSSSAVEPFRADEDEDQLPDASYQKASSPTSWGLSDPRETEGAMPAVAQDTCVDLTGDGEADVKSDGDEIEFVEPGLGRRSPDRRGFVVNEAEDPCGTSLEAIGDGPGGGLALGPAPSCCSTRPPRRGSDGEPPRDLVLGPAGCSPLAVSPGVAARKSFQDSGPLPKPKPGKPRSGLQLQGLCVRGRSFKTMKSPEPMMPGMMQDDPDEFLMDGILEETGMVFGTVSLLGGGLRDDGQLAKCGISGFFSVTGSSLPPLGTTSSSMPDVGISMGNSSRYMSDLCHLEEEHMRLEAELLNMGLDLEELDEQEALLQSCIEQFRPDPEEEMAVLRESLQADMSLSSMLSVEAC